MSNWQTVLVVSLLLISSAISVVLIFLVLRKKGVPGVMPFTLMVAGIGVWALFYAFEIASPELEMKYVWAELQYIGISVIPVGWFLFAQSYSGNDRWMDLKKSAFLLIIPGITILIALTNPAHELLWADFSIGSAEPLSVFVAERYGLWWWFFFVYSYGLLMAGTIRIIQSLRTRVSAFKGQFALILASLVLPWLSNFAYLARISPIPQIDLSPIAFTISAILLGVAIFRFRLFDLVPAMNLAVVRRLDAPAFILDAKNRIIDLNDGALTLLTHPNASPEEKPIETVFEWWADLPISVQKSEEVNQDISLVMNGLRRYYNIQITPIWTIGAKVAARMVIIRDITGDKLASEAMALAQVKTEFLAKVGHELRSPLTSILGVAEMLDYGVYGPLSEQQLKAVRMISDSTQHMTRMVNDLLQQSKMERGTFKLDITLFPIRELLHQIVEHFKPMTRIKELSLLVDVEPQVPEKIESDSLRLYQILVNLTDNAIKYTLEGQIRIRVFLPDTDHFAFQITDTGVGIPKEVQRLIFNPFQQAIAFTDQQESGFGLGLSIVKQLVSLMEGTIELDSEVGKGSTFTVILPATTVRDKSK